MQGRQIVGVVQKAMAMSERRACRTLGVSRASYRYTSTRKEPRALVEKLRELAKDRPRFGYRRLYQQLRRRGHKVNHKRVYRLYKLEGLHIRTKRRKRLAASPRLQLPKAERPGERWAMDFVSDHLVCGRRFRILAIVDQCSRRCPGVLVETSIPGAQVARFLDEVGGSKLPSGITVDNGPTDGFATSASTRTGSTRSTRRGL